MSKTLEDLSLQINTLTDRIKNLERHLGVEVTEILKPEIPATTNEPLNQSDHSTPQARSQKTPTEVGGKLLGFAAGLCFLLAAGYVIQLAITSGWLTPSRQLGLLLVFGISLIVAGCLLRSKDSLYAGILPGIGLAVLWMTIYGGHHVLEVLSLNQVFLSGLVLTALSFWLFRIFDQPFFLFAMIAGAYTVPFFLPKLSAPKGEIWGYFLVLDLLFCYLAFELRSRGLIALSAYFSLVIFWTIAQLQNISPLSAAFFQAVQLSIFLTTTVALSLYNKLRLTSAEAWALFPVGIFFYLSEYLLIYKIAEEIAPWLALGFAFVLLVLLRAVEYILKAAPLASRPSTATFIGLIVFHSLFLVILDEAVQPWFAVMLLSLGQLFYAHFRDKEYNWLKGVYWLPIIIEYIAALDSKRLEVNLAFSGLFLFSYFRKQRDKNVLALWLGALQSVVGLSLLASSFDTGIHESYLDSALVALFAFLLMFAAKSFLDKSAATLALILFLFVSIKVIFIDLSASSPFAKVITLVLVGALLFGGGMLQREIGRKNV